MLVFAVGYPVAVFLEGFLLGAAQPFIPLAFSSTLQQLMHFALIFFATLPLVQFCWKIQFWDALFFCAAAYSLEHIGYAATSILSFLLERNGFSLPMLILPLGIKGLVIFAAKTEACRPQK